MTPLKRAGLTSFPDGVVLGGKRKFTGMPKYTFHALRHFCVSKWIARKVDILVITQWIGHKDATTTWKVYAHLLGEQDEGKQKIEQAAEEVMSHSKVIPFPQKAG